MKLGSGSLTRNGRITSEKTFLSNRACIIRFTRREEESKKTWIRFATKPWQSIAINDTSRYRSSPRHLQQHGLQPRRPLASQHRLRPLSDDTIEAKPFSEASWAVQRPAKAPTPRKHRRPARSGLGDVWVTGASSNELPNTNVTPSCAR